MKKTQKNIEEPPMGNVWGCWINSNVNVSEHVWISLEHFGKYTMISERPYLPPPAVAFISTFLLHLLSAHTLEPVWERISERWGASRWPRKKSWTNKTQMKTSQGSRPCKSSVHSLAKGVFSFVLMSTHSKQLATFACHFPPPFAGRSSRQSRAGVITTCREIHT